MAKGNNQKLKLLYLAQIFSQETDEEHQLTLKEIADKLANYGVNADRNATDWRRRRAQVRAGDTLRAKMAPGGGWAARFSRGR